MAKSSNFNEDFSGGDSNQTTFNDDEEEKHFRKILAAFLYYR